MRLETREHCGSRKDSLPCPLRSSADIHVLDEANLCVQIAAELKKVDQLVVVHPADYHRVQLQSAEPRRQGCINSREHLPQRITLRKVAESLWSERIEADRNAVQSGSLERRRVLGEKHTVGG